MDCSVQYKQFLYDISVLRHVAKDFPSRAKCPICEMTKGKLPEIISMDGNMQLVRKRSSGQSYRKTHQGSLLFMKHEDVEPYIKKESTATSNVNIFVFKEMHKLLTYYF